MPRTRYYYHTHFTDGKLGIVNSWQRQAFGSSGLLTIMHCCFSCERANNVMGYCVCIGLKYSSVYIQSHFSTYRETCIRLCKLDAH